ncbi:MAG TPA: hypothetical protein VGX00_01930 [Thermoplasmata archaeon]|nr:hypothetical protein [Thermoplasmata archaeon]
MDRYSNPKEARAALAMSVPGLGIKEASHFLRNVGRGSDIAVLDVHLRRFLAESGMVGPRIAFSGSPSSYASIEGAYTSLAFHSGLDTAALDLAIWEYMRER